MSLPVHLVPSLEAAAAGDLVQVTGDEAHHAVAVRRLRVGEGVLLTDGRGRCARGEVTGAAKRALDVRVAELWADPAPQPRVTVVQALPKGDRGELAVEMLTEIGVDEVVPWAAARCVAVWRGDRAVRSHARWAATAREAAKQARRSWLPEVAALATTGEVAGRVAAADLAVVLHEDADEPLARLDPPDGAGLLVVVGPEGGLTDEEAATFAAAGGRVVRLGSEILRTSTAGVAAVAALLARTPRWL